MPLPPAPPRAFFYLPWLVALLALVLAETFPTAVIRSGEWAFLGSAVFLGLPHGALDLWWPRWEWPTLRKIRPYLAYLGAYLAAMGLMALIWRWNVAVAFSGFVFLTAWHWGSGDLWPWPQKVGPAIFLSFGKGLLVMGAPLAFHSAEVGKFFVDLSGTSIPDASWRQIGVGLVVAAAIAQTIGSTRPGRTPWKAPAAEWVGLLLLAWRLPAFAFVALYFAWFHSFRHILRVTAQPAATAPGRMLWRGTIVAIAMVAAVLTVILHENGAVPSLASSLGSYFVALSVLTLPHALLVAAWDRRSWLNVGAPPSN